MLYREYLEKVGELLDRVRETQGEQIKNAAELLARAIKKGGVVHVFGCGHSQMFGMELFYRAGGLVPVNAILTPALSLAPTAPLSTFGERQEGLAGAILDNQVINPEDVMIIASTSGRNAVPVEMAIEARERGMDVIALTSLQFSQEVTSRHKSGKKLYELADVILDSLSVPGDAVMGIEGMETRFGPTSSVIGFAILQALVSQTIENLMKEGYEPPVWVSSNLDEGDAINKKHIEKYRGRLENL